MDDPQPGSQMLLFEAPRREPDKQLIGDTDDHIAILVSLRQRLAQQIDQTDSARDLASLTSRLMEVIATIDEREASASVREVQILSVFQGRRQERQSRATGQD